MKSKLSLKRKCEILVEGFVQYLKNKRAGSLPRDSKVHDPNALWNFFMFKRPLVYVPMAIGIVVALTAPLDVMDRLDWLQPLSDWIRRVFPPMNGYVQNSAFPQVTELYFLLMALHAPVHFYYMWELLNLPLNVTARRSSWQQASLWRKAFVCTTFFPMATAVIYFGLVLNDGIDFKTIPLNTSRVSLAFAGWAVSGPGFLSTAAVVIVLVREILSGSINRPITHLQREHRK